MRIDFTKMHGLGNDFVVFDAAADAKLPTVDQWRHLADRHTGIGFDQAAVLLPPRQAGSDISYRIFNADGSEAEQSGNGVRCVAALLHRRGRANGTLITLEAAGRLARARVLPDGLVSVDMGPPDFDPKSVPFDAPAQCASYSISAGGETFEIGAVSMGNPHAVLRVEAVESAPVERVGKALQASARFPRQVNVGFMQVLQSDQIRLRVYERGAGETLACGSGSCAAVAVGRNLGLLGADVVVHVRGGRLGVHWEGAGQPIWLTGPAEIAYEGQVNI